MLNVKKTFLVNVLNHLANVLVLSVFFGIILFLLYTKLIRVRPVREYSGVVVEKWIGIGETQQGSHLFSIILVKTDGGEQIEAGVDQDTYEQLQKGTRVWHDAKGIRLDSSPADPEEKIVPR